MRVAPSGSRREFRRARRSLAGGVNSPVRSFRAVGGTPIFFARGRGAHLWDVDGVRYLDLLGSWGATILGHSFPSVVDAVRRQARLALSFGAPSSLEHELAERIRSKVPQIDRIRFVNSGTEAVMSAVRLARGFTGRPKVMKFAGGYHGHSDGLLARAGSGAASVADSAGVPPTLVRETIVTPYNDADELERQFEKHGAELAAVVVEPIAGNMNVVPSMPGFLPGLGRLCHEHGVLLIADEVITGFRLRAGIISTELGVRPDLVTLGKIIGGGLPVGAYGGRSEIMAMVAPEGPVYQAGTLSGNPVGMAAGAATLDALTPRVYAHLERMAVGLERAWKTSAPGAFHLTRVGSMFGLFFGERPPHNFSEALRGDRRAYAEYFHAMLDEGVYLPPSPLETAFVSAAFKSRDVDWAERAASNAFAGLGPR